MPIYISKEMIEKLPPVSKINYGRYGICYKLNSNTVLKIFTRKLEEDVKKNIRRNLKRQSPIIMYPKDAVYVEQKSKFMDGYTCPLAPGIDFNTLYEQIENNENDLSFDKLLSAYYNEFLNELNNEKIYLNDVKPNHVFIDDSMSLIDSDFFKSVPLAMTNKEKKKQNLIEVNSSIIAIINHYLPGDCWVNNNIESEEFLYNYLINIEKVTNKDVDSIFKLSNYKFKDSQIDELRKVL